MVIPSPTQKFSTPSLLWLALSAFMLISGCAGPLASQNDDGPSEQVEAAKQRLPDYYYEELNSYRRAITQKTRTESGKPGSEYWQQRSNFYIDAELVPEDTMLYGEGTIVYYNNSPDTLGGLYMELTQNFHKQGVPRNESTEITGGMEITHVAYDGDTLGYGGRVGARYVIDGTIMVVVGSEPLAPGDSATIDVNWNFKVPQKGIGARMGHSLGNLYYIGYWYPFVSVYDDVNGWFTDRFLGQSEFYMGYSNYELNITLPEQWLVMATGEFLNPEEVLADSVLMRYRQAAKTDSVVHLVTADNLGRATKTSENDEGTLTWKFHAKDVRDVAFTATLESNWDATRTPVGDRDGDGQTDYSRIHSFWRDIAPLWSEVAEYSAHAITYLSDYTGIPYPYPHMTAVEGAEIIGGGMEFPMMTLMGDYNRAGADALYYVTAHELAHMWVPMIVGVNERRYAWMDEGTTTFNENMARTDRFEGSTPHRRDQANYLRIADTDWEGEIMRWSNFHYNSYAYGIASYSKPGSILVALRGVLGEETFNKAYQTYLADWAYKHPYPFDMFRSFEASSGQDLDWFWKSWYYKTWYLDQALQAVAETEEGWTVVVDDRGEIPMPVLLRFTLADDSTVDRRIEVDEWLDETTTITKTYNFGSAVQKVEIDPDYHFPDLDRENNVWNLEE